MAMEQLKTPVTFPFPFSPYSIQEDFMKSLYTALEEGKLGIFESPTGTGKSLSLICGALTWLRDHEARERDNLEKLLKAPQEGQNCPKTEDNSGPPSWLTDQAVELKAREVKAKAKITLDAMSKFHTKISKFRLDSKARKKKGNVKGQARSNHPSTINANSTEKEKAECYDLDDDVLLEECSIDSHESSCEADDEAEEETEELFHCTKIFFCSRTHSQLAQFVNEVQKSPFASNIRLAPLASRQSYCINEAVNKLKSLALINERCLDLQKKTSSKITAVSKSGETLKKARKTGSSSHCPAMNRSAIELFSQDIVSEVQDVEQIVRAGKDLNACPYYASRASVAFSQVVVIPYNILLHKATREACGIKVKNNIVIIDEAHNLLESIGSIHSMQVNGNQLSYAHSQLVQYKNKYMTRFSPSTLLHLNQVIFIVGKLIRILGGKAGCDPNVSTNTKLDTQILTLPDFVISAEIDNLNLFKLLSFCKSSKLCHKLHGFSKLYGGQVKIHEPANKIDGIRAFLKDMKTSNISGKAEDKNDEQTAPDASKDSSNNPFLMVMGFLESLTSDFADGRILLRRELTVGKGSLKFLLLNPAAHFQDIIREARSVIVAGGTMEPVSEFQNQLFVSAGASMDRILHFSCGHIIPPENILPLVLGCGPSGKQFDFSYSQRESSVMIKELGRLILNVCNVVPAGVVCFFPSYEYEKHVIQCFEKDGIISQIERKKKIFREPKKSSDVEEILSAYASCIQQSRKSGLDKLSGAILFSVIGGKLSEGINFSDDLGRCVIVIGLPFPNIKSVELQEQMKFLDKTQGDGAGKSHYENLCMKAVNQSIGRAVRHKNDYAAVLLIDHRYLQKARQTALPTWIQHSLVSYTNFGPAFKQLAEFFLKKRTRTQVN